MGGWPDNRPTSHLTLLKSPFRLIHEVLSAFLFVG